MPALFELFPKKRFPHAPWSAALWFVLLIWVSSSTFAQSQPYQFDHWTTDNGLPQNTVFRVLQTRDRYLWLTTFDGLARFDGVRFKVFDKSNTKGINGNRFTDLYETQDGTLLFGTDDAGLTVYRNGGFKTYTTADGLPSNQIYLIFPDLTGAPVIATSLGPVFWRDGKIVPAPPQFQSSNSKHYLASSGMQVMIDANGIKQVKDGRAIEYSIKPFSDNFFNDLWPYEDRQGNLWVGDGAKVYRLRDGQVTHFSDVSLLRPVCDDADGGVWFTRPLGKVTESSMARFKDGRFTFYGEAEGILNSTVYSIAKDQEDSIWMATSHGWYRARKIYRDGVLVASDISKGMFQASGVMNIGRAVWGEAYFTGHLDDLRIYNRALPVSDIQLLAAGNQ